MVYAQTTDSTNTRKSFYLDSTNYFKQNKLDSGFLKSNSGLSKLKNRIIPDSASLYELLTPKIKGRIGFEGYHTSFQNPRMLSESQYLRLSGNTSISMGGLPLLVDIYRTSETQTFYNSNYIKVKFDYQTFISNITKQWEQQMQRASTDANLSKYQSKVHDKLIIETEKQKDALKNQQLSLETKLNEQQEALLLQYQNQADSVSLSLKDSLTTRIGAKRDSIEKNEHPKMLSADSMKLEQLKNDTQRIAESLREIETQLQNLQNKRR